AGTGQHDGGSPGSIVGSVGDGHSRLCPYSTFVSGRIVGAFVQQVMHPCTRVQDVTQLTRKLSQHSAGTTIDAYPHFGSVGDGHSRLCPYGTFLAERTANSLLETSIFLLRPLQARYRSSFAYL